MKNQIYIASPLFSEAERDFNLKICNILERNNIRVFLPQRECRGLYDVDIFNKCLDGLDNSKFILAILDGADSDSGTCWECGYAFAKNKLVISMRTDFRDSGECSGLNFMLFYGTQLIKNKGDFYTENFEKEFLRLIKDYDETSRHSNN